MDKKLQLIQHLYGETDDRDALRELLKDEDLNHEYQELSEAKFWLDHTHHERPDSSVLDTIFAAAAQESTQHAAQSPTVHKEPAPQQARTLHELAQQAQQVPPPSRAFREDRAPAASKPKRRRLYGSLTAVFTLVIAVGIGYQFFTPQNIMMESATQSLADRSTAAPAELDEALGLESIAADKAEVAEEQGLGFSAPLAESEPELEMADSDAALRAASVSMADTSLPEWNEDLDEVLRFQRRIDMLLEQNQDLAWDEAAIPLEALPAGRTSNPALLQAGSRKSTSGNQ